MHVTDEHLRRGDILRQEAEIEGADDERALALGLETDDVRLVVIEDLRLGVGVRDVEVARALRDAQAALCVRRT